MYFNYLEERHQVNSSWLHILELTECWVGIQNSKSAFAEKNSFPIFLYLGHGS